MLFHWKVYGLVGGGASFGLLAPGVREGCFLYLLFITYLFCLVPEKDLRRTKHDGVWPALP